MKRTLTLTPSILTADPLNPIPIHRIPAPRTSIPSVNSPIRFTNDDDDSDDEDKKPSYQGYSLPKIVIIKLYRDRLLFISYALEWLLDDILD